MKKAAMVLSGFLSIATFAYPLGFSLKLAGGVAVITGGDYNAGLEGLNSYYSASYQNVDGAFSKINLATDFGLEFIIHLTSKMGLGLGVGSLKASRGAESVSYDWMLFSSPMHDTVTLKTSISSIPITLNFHYDISLGALKLNLFGGAGYYPSRMKVETGFQSTFLGMTKDVVFDSNSIKGQFGFQAGVGLEVPLGRWFAFVLDLAGRYVSLGDIRGDYTLRGSLLGATITKSGTDYYLYVYDHYYGSVSYKLLTWTDDASKPSGGIDSNALHARFDLSGVTAQAGIEFRF